jgi:hypothetical protein
MLMFFGREETIAIQFLRTVVLRLHRSVIPGRPNCVEGWTEEMLVYVWWKFRARK